MTDNNIILYTLMTIFVVVGIVTPFVTNEFTDTTTDVDIEGFRDELGQNDPGSIAVILSMVSMFFWTFGALPLFLDMFFLILRVIFFNILYDKIRRT